MGPGLFPSPLLLFPPLFAASPLSVATGLLVNAKEEVKELAATNGLEFKS